MLKQGDYKQVVIPTNKEAEDFEQKMQMKSLILASFFYARHQGKGGNDSVDNFFVYAKKLEEKQPDQFGFKSALGSSFMCTSDTLLQLI